MHTIKDRESNFELLRLVSIFFIVLYHILFFIIVKVDENPIFRALYLPLHVAVICFVLISGYFHIRPSLRGAIKIISPLLIIYFPLTLFEYYNGYGRRGILHGLFFFSKSPYWFIRTYFCLFMVAPILNAYIKFSNKRLYLLMVLGFISVYMGTIQEPSLKTGKNLALFMFLYVLGDTIRAHMDVLKKIRIYHIVAFYLFLNFTIVTLYLITYDHLFGKVLWRLCYPYCSPVLIINATLLFVIFGRIRLKSRMINYLSASVFTIYIIHHQHYVLYYLIKPAALYVYSIFDTPVTLLLALCILTIGILMVSVFIDKLFSPLWNQLSMKAMKFDDSIHSYKIW